MIAQRAYSNPPFRRGLADFMAATEERGGAYDDMFGAPVYSRRHDLRRIFGNQPIVNIRAPRGLELVATELVIAALHRARRRLIRAGSIERLASVEIALLGENRIRARQLAKRRTEP
jgi:hypothetical protein